MAGDHLSPANALRVFSAGAALLRRRGLWLCPEQHGMVCLPTALPFQGQPGMAVSGLVGAGFGGGLPGVSPGALLGALESGRTALRRVSARLEVRS